MSKKNAAWKKISKLEKKIEKSSDSNKIRELHLQVINLKRDAGISLSVLTPEEDNNSGIRLGQIALITM